MAQPSKARIWGALWVVYLVWGSTYLGIEYAIQSMPPLLAMGSRFLAAGLIMILALALRFGPRFLAITRRQALFLTILGSLLLGLGLGLVVAVLMRHCSCVHSHSLARVHSRFAAHLASSPKQWPTSAIPDFHFIHNF